MKRWKGEGDGFFPVYRVIVDGLTRDYPPHHHHFFFVTFPFSSPSLTLWAQGGYRQRQRPWTGLLPETKHTGWNVGVDHYRGGGGSIIFLQIDAGHPTQCSHDVLSLYDCGEPVKCYTPGKESFRHIHQKFIISTAEY